MAVACTYFKHQNLTGENESYFLDNDFRYKWVKFGSTLRNEITSFRANASAGRHGNVYGFTNNDFSGGFAALNVPDGWACWWNNVGPLNDDIESAIQVNRNFNEFELELGGMIKEPFKTELDAFLEGTQVHRSGEPIVRALFWPAIDPSRKFVRIEQPIVVELDWWPDYDAKIIYDVYFYLESPTVVKAYVAWITTWVEGGVFSGSINDELHPKAVAGASKLNDALAAQLPLLSLVAAFRGPIQRIYLLPGLPPEMPPPDSNFGRIGHANEGCVLVLTFQ